MPVFTLKTQHVYSCLLLILHAVYHLILIIGVFGWQAQRGLVNLEAIFSILLTKEYNYA